MRPTHPLAVAGRHTAPRTVQVATDREQAADSSTEDRIHAWYREHGVAAARSVGERTPAKAAGTAHAPTTDLATVPGKATAADFDRAAAAQRQTIRSQAEQNSHQTTAADDAADAETHIPSTAPTAREPLPFVHGSDPDVPAMGGTSRRNAAPIVRSAPQPQATGSVSALPRRTPAMRPATAQPTVDLSAPTVTQTTAPVVSTSIPHLEVPAVRAATHNAPAARDAVVLAATPLAMTTTAPPRSIRAIAAETANEPTPRLQLPVPPATTTRKPAISAVQAGNVHPVLDPAVSAGMADETFDGDSMPATANTAIRLATSGVHPHGEAVDDSGPLRPIPVINVMDGQGHLLLLPPMKGTHEILVHQNQMAMADGLERIQNDRQLDEMRRTRLLVALPDDDGIYPNDALPMNRRFARPWTVRFLRDIARAHYARFGSPLIVTSAARTVEFQRRLVRVNGNAAPPTGDIASPHLYGQAIDLAKRGMSLTEITWMRAYLTPVEDDGKIDVEEEFQQACFHISVYRRYLGVAAPKKPAQELQRPVLLQAKAAVPAPEKKHHLPTALLATHLP